MKFNIPKIIKSLELGEYDESLEGLALRVWVNPPRGVHASYWKVQAELVRLSKALEDIKDSDAKKIEEINIQIDIANNNVFGWFANIWSQDPNAETHTSLEDVERIADEDPALWSFITSSTTKMIREHRDDQRKN